MTANGEDSQPKQLTIQDIKGMKASGEKIAVHSPMDYNTAQMVEEAGADIVIVGDSLPTMILGGDPNTFGSTIEAVVFFTARVAKAIRHAVIVSGLPYGSYQESNEKAIDSAVQLIKAGAHSVKVQGASDTILARIKAIIDMGIPVMGHVGLMPHYIRQIGGFRAVGKNVEEALKIYRDVKALEQVGAWCIEMECVPERVAAETSKRTRIPIIGIGSGSGTDGQSLAFHDILGLQKKQRPKHAKCYKDLWPICVDALRKYTEEVKEKRFPTEGHSFGISEEVLTSFLNRLD